MSERKYSIHNLTDKTIHLYESFGSSHLASFFRVEGVRPATLLGTMKKVELWYKSQFLWPVQFEGEPWAFFPIIAEKISDIKEDEFEVIGLPDPQPFTFYIVPEEVALARQSRTDLLYCAFVFKNKHALHGVSCRELGSFDNTRMES